jgi:hypothetical protein
MNIFHFNCFHRHRSSRSLFRLPRSVSNTINISFKLIVIIKITINLHQIIIFIENLQMFYNHQKTKQKNFVALSPRANYTD